MGIYHQLAENETGSEDAQHAVAEGEDSQEHLFIDNSSIQSYKETFTGNEDTVYP